MPRAKYKKQPDGRYRTRIYLGTEDGKAKYKSVYATTVAELERKAEELRYALHKGGDVLSGDLPFRTWAERFLRLKKSKIGHVYYTGLDGRVQFWCRAVGDMPLSKITRSDLQVHLDELAEKNPKTKKPTAKKTLIDYRCAAAGVFELAITDRAINYNPAERLEIHRHAPSSRRRALTETEQQWILHTPHRAQTAAMIMMLAGLRRGELIPLEVRDIDLEGGTLSVFRSVSMPKGRPTVKDGGKTESAERVINLPKTLIDYLRPLLADRSPFDLVVTDTRGQMFSDTAWRRMWDSYLLDLNLKYGTFIQQPTSKFDPKGVPFVIPRLTPHMLRHTCATNMVMAGMDVATVKEQMGHKDIQTTLNIYTHVDTKHRQSQVDKLDAFLASRHIG